MLSLEHRTLKYLDPLSLTLDDLYVYSESIAYLEFRDIFFLVVLCDLI